MGPDDGSQRGLRLVVDPKVPPRAPRLFPFWGAVGVSAVVTMGLAFGAARIWTRLTVLTEGGAIVVVASPFHVEEPKEVLKAVERSIEAPPLAPAVAPTFTVHVFDPQEVPAPEVEVSAVPFELSELWQEAAKPFPVPEPPEPEVRSEPKPRQEVARVARNQPARPAAKPALVKSAAQVARQVAPQYPSAARRAGVEGQVLLHVAVQSNGRVGSVSLVSSSGSGLLDDAAMRAVRKWSFRPAMIGGEPTSGELRVPVRFQLR